MISLHGYGYGQNRFTDIADFTKFLSEWLI